MLSPDGRVTYCNAGHNPPILASSAGVRRLESGGMVLGIFEDAPYAEDSVTLRPDDYLVLFSDGISEAMNGEEEEFGDDRLSPAPHLRQREAVHGFGPAARRRDGHGRGVSLVRDMTTDRATRPGPP